MSAPIAAGLALLDGAVSVRGFEPESLSRPDLREAISRIEVGVDEECEREYPRRRSGAVTIELKDGRTVAARVLDPKGEGQNPLPDADLERKFRANCEPVLGRNASEAALGTIWDFRKEQGGLAGLLQALTPAD
jgi:2-methylcitrate dehydratase PrpD